MKTDFLRLEDLDADRIVQLIERARTLKAQPECSRSLPQRTLMMLFEKPSTRTRLSLSVAMTQLGGQSLFVHSSDAQIARGEPVEDVARVAGSMVDAVAMRTDSHERLESFARHCRVPVINALSDRFHPCQALADVLTLDEEFGGLDGLRVAWVGDGNNVLHSWLEASALLGLPLRYCCPPGRGPDPELAAAAPLAEAVAEPAEAVRGASVVSTDVWVSMNQEGNGEVSVEDFAGWQVDSNLMRCAADNAILLHCLPAHRGQEITAEVMEAPCSRIWQQAENRLHAQKALLEFLLAAD